MFLDASASLGLGVSNMDKVEKNTEERIIYVSEILWKTLHWRIYVQLLDLLSWPPPPFHYYKIFQIVIQVRHHPSSSAKYIISTVFFLTLP